MKYLVYLLLAANVAYFAWIQSQPAPVPPVPQSRPLPSGVEPLVLLSERNRVGTVAASATKPAEADVMVELAPDAAAPSSADIRMPPVTEVASICRTLGPLASADEATGLRDRLTTRGFPAALREGEIQVPSGYQVYLRATSSGNARDVVSGLEAAGMTDYFVGKRNRISLGIFSSKSKAQVRREAVRKLGYDAMLNVRYKTRKVFWIDIEEVNRQPGSSQDWQQVMADYPQIKVQQVSCE